jgi:hypothetical protein
VALAMLQVGALGSVLLYYCAAEQGARTSCCCPSEAEPAAVADAASSNGPPDPVDAFGRAPCCTVEAVSLGHEASDSVRAGAAPELTAAAPPPVLLPRSAAPMDAPRLALVGSVEVRGPPLLLVKQSFLR